MISLRPYQQEALDAINFYYDKNIVRQLVVLPTGCHEYNQGILMYNGTIKPVQEIEVGDFLMGPHSEPKQVLQLHRGHGRMHTVTPIKGTPFRVNEDHVLTLIRTSFSKIFKGKKYQYGNNIVDVSVRDYLTWSETKKHQYKLFRRPVYFYYNHHVLPVDPYYIGLWLGDGSSRNTDITNIDVEVEEYLKLFARSLHLKFNKKQSLNRTPTLSITSGIGAYPNHLLDSLRELNLIQNKHIPYEYKTSSYTNRLMLLAGLMDSDGSLSHNGFDYISINEQLAQDVTYVARSLGFAAYVTETIKHSQNETACTAYRVSISGHTDVVPTQIQRKQASKRLQKKDVLRTGFSVNASGTDNYYGFTLTGDGRYLLDDFTVTHNSGKTVLFSHLPQTRTNALPMLILAHRAELLVQAQQKIGWANPELNIEIEQGENVAGYADVVVASVPTLGRADSERILKYPKNYFKTIVIDEAHHAAAPSYKRILEYFDTEFVLGVTATPQRSDKIRLTDVFDEIVYYKTIQDLIEDKWLCPLVGYRIKTDTDISGVATNDGDYIASQLEDVIDNPTRNATIVAAYNSLVPETKAIVFCAGIQHANNVAASFRQAQIPTQTILGETPAEEREKIYQQFSTGEIKVLVNVGVLTEGFDEPTVQTIILARPTRSTLLYTQIVGRGTRLHEGKQHCTILDIADTTKGKKPIGLPSLLGLPADFDLQGQDLVEVAKEYKELEQFCPGEAVRVLQPEDIQLAYTRINLFMPPPPNEFVQEYSRFVWAEVSENEFHLGINNNNSLKIFVDALGRWVVEHHQRVNNKVETKILGYPDDMRDAFVRSDKWIMNRFDTKLIDSSETWRSDGPTDAQKKMLKRIGVPLTSDMTKGTASQIISKYYENNPKPAWLEHKIARSKNRW